MRKLTALKNVTLSQGTPLGGGINSSIQDCQQKKEKKAAPTICVLCVMMMTMAREDGFMAVNR